MTEASNGEIHRKVQKALKVGGDTHTVDDIVDAVNSEYMQL
jgi:hypothetical protein